MNNNELKHTPTPWAYSVSPIDVAHNDDAGSIWKDNGEGSALIAHFSKSPGIEAGKANTIRAVACVNACDGLDTAALELNIVGNMLAILKQAQEDKFFGWSNELATRAESAIAKATNTEKEVKSHE